MPQPQLARDEAGHTWDVSNPANPVLVRQAPQSPVQIMGGPQLKTANPDEQSTIHSGAIKGANDAGASQYSPAAAAEALRTAALTNRQFVGDPNKHGEAYRESIGHNSWLYNMVPLVARGEVDPKQLLGGGERGNSDAKILFSAVSQYDPSWSPSVGQARFDTRQDYQSSQGHSNGDIGAADRATKSLRIAQAASDAMSGDNTGWRTLNQLLVGREQEFGKNIVPAQVFRSIQPELTNQFNAVTGGGVSGGSDTSRATLQAGIPMTASQAERNAGLETYAKGIVNALTQKQRGWDAAFQGTAPIPRWIDPDNANYLEKTGGGGSGSLDPYKNTPAPSGSPWVGYTPPPSNGGGGAPLALTPASGATADAPYSQETKNHLDQLAKMGVGPDVATAYLQTRPDGKGHAVNPDSWNAATAAAADYKQKNGTDYPGSFNAYKTAPLTPAQDGVQAFGLNGGKVGTLAANYANSAAMGIPAWLGGGQARAGLAQESADHPWMAGIGSAAGFGTSALAGGAGIKGVGALLARDGGAIGTLGTELSTNKVLPGLLSNMGAGAATGATGDPNDPLNGAARGAFMGAAGDVVGGAVIAPGLRAAAGTGIGQSVINGVGGAASKIKGMFGGDPVPQFVPAAQDPANLTIQRSMGLTPAAFDQRAGVVQGKLQSAADLGLPYGLGDATKGLRSLTGSAVRNGGDQTLDLADDLLGKRQLSQNDRAVSMINTHLAPTGDIQSIVDANKVQAQAASKPFYDAAKQQPPVNDPRINGMLSTPLGARSARTGYDAALNGDTSPADLSMSIDPTTGQPSYDASLNWPTLQSIKIGMNGTLRSGAKDAFGRLDMGDPINQGVNTLRQNFTDRLHELNPDYAKADGVYGDVRGQGTAAQSGYNATNPKITPTQLGQTMSGLQPPSAVTGDPLDYTPNFQQGYASSMGDTIGNMRQGNPYNAVNGSNYQQQKLNMIFPQGARQFQAAQVLEGDMSKTNQEALGGSQTQPRAMADKAFAGSNLGGEVLDATIGLAAHSGGIGMASGWIRNGIRDLWNLRGAGDSEARAQAIAPMLLNHDPQAGLGALNELMRQKALIDAQKAQFRPYGGMFGASATPGIAQGFSGGASQPN